MADDGSSAEAALGKRQRYDWSNRERYLGFTAPCNADRTWGAVSTLYVMRSGSCLKIGIADDITKRLTQLRAGNPHGIDLAARRTVPKPMARQIERRLHAHFADRAIGREWFDGVTVAEITREAMRQIGYAKTAMGRWRRDGFCFFLDGAAQ